MAQSSVPNESEFQVAPLFGGKWHFIEDDLGLGKEPPFSFNDSLEPKDWFDRLYYDDILKFLEAGYK